MTTLTKSRIHGTDVVTAEGTIVGTTVANWLWKDERTLELVSCSSMITLHE